MRKIILFLPIFFIFFASLMFAFSNNAHANIDDPKGLWAAARCDGTKSIVTFYWDITGYSEPYTAWEWDIVINPQNGGKKVPVNDPSDMPHVIDVTNHNPGQTYDWKIQNGDKTCGSFIDDCEGSTDGPRVTRADCTTPDTPPEEPNETTCPFCPELSLSYPNYTGYKGDVMYCDDGDASCATVFRELIFLGGANYTDFTSPYCLYVKAHNPNIVTSVTTDTCTANRSCSETDGCIRLGQADYSKCSIDGSGVMKPCRSQADCKGSDPNCATNWCVDTISGTLISDETADNYGASIYCKSFPEEPPCPEGADCEDPFNEIPDPECTPGIDKENCFSGICNKDGECEKGVTAISCTAYDILENRFGDIKEAKFVCNTAIGPISADAKGFSQSLLKIILGLAGGFLIILIIINGYKIMTSQGDPEKLKDAREGIIAAIAGILLIIFSLSILQLITVDVIGLPRFGK